MIPLLALALLAPADTPIEPIPLSAVDATIDTVDGTRLCATAAQMGVLFIQLEEGTGEVGIADLFAEWYIAWGVDEIEDGVNPAGSLTLEAEARLEDWLGECLGLGV